MGCGLEIFNHPGFRPSLPAPVPWVAYMVPWAAVFRSKGRH